MSSNVLVVWKHHMRILYSLQLSSQLQLLYTYMNYVVYSYMQKYCACIKEIIFTLYKKCYQFYYFQFFVLYAVAPPRHYAFEIMFSENWGT